LGGVYIVKENDLVVGPFHGPVACTRISKGKGVCGSSWTKADTIIVPDVNAFAGHIACNSASKSEIVVPVIRCGEVVAVLDVDSDRLDAFDAIDQHYLKKILDLIDFTV
jgi:GAF domain-containing protein